MDIFKQMIKMGYDLVDLMGDFANAIIGFMTKSVVDLLTESPFVGDALIGTILDVLNIGDISVWQMMLGGGVVVYLTYQLIVWLLNVIT